MQAAYLMVSGGTHPRGSTSINVTPLGDGIPYSPAAYDAAAKAFYFANTKCLTPGSTFESMRVCTGETCDPQNILGDNANILNAWSAVVVV